MTQTWLAVNHNTSVFSVLDEQVNLVAVNQSCVIHEAMHGCKTKGLLKDCFENVNITKCQYEEGEFYKLAVPITSKVSK